MVEQRRGSSRAQQTTPAPCWTFRLPARNSPETPQIQFGSIVFIVWRTELRRLGHGAVGTKDFPVFVLASGDPSPLQPRCSPSSEPRGPSTPQEAPQGPSSSGAQDRPSSLAVPKLSVAKDQVFISFCFVFNFQSIVGRYFYKIQFK